MLFSGWSWIYEWQVLLSAFAQLRLGPLECKSPVYHRRALCPPYIPISHYLYLYTHLHSLPPSFSVCMMHLYSFPSLLTEVGTFPSAGASSRCSRFLSSLPSLSPSLPLLYQCALGSVWFFFSPPSHSFPVSQWQQLREAAACESPSQLLQVKTSALLDNFNEGDEAGEHLLLRLQVLIPVRGAHF